MEHDERTIGTIRGYLRDNGLDAFIPAKPAHVAYLTRYYDKLHVNILWEEMASYLAITPSAAFIVGAHEHWAGPPGTGVAPAWISERIRGGLDGYETLQVLAGELRRRGLDAGRIGIETTWLPVALHEALRERLPRAEFVPANDLVPQLRLLKTPVEHELLRRAAAAGVASMEAYMAAIRAGRGEAQALLARAAAALEHGAEWVGGAYHVAWTGGIDNTPDWWSPPVRERFRRCPDRYWHGVVGSPDYCVTHFEAMYQYYYADLAWHEFICEPKPGARIDFGEGARVEFREAQEDFDILRRMQSEALAQITPGMTHAEAIGKLKAFVAADPLFSAHCTGYFIHGVGLEIHEEPVFTSATPRAIPQGGRIRYDAGAVVSSEWFSKYWTVEEPFALTAGGWKPLVPLRGLLS